MENRKINNKETSIYELIKKNIQSDGRLEKNFRLLDEEYWSTSDDGQEDVQCLEYIDSMIEADIESLIDIILKISTNNFDEIEKELENYFEDYGDTILIYREPLYNYFNSIKNNFSFFKNTSNFFEKMLTKSRNIFVVKISIIILTILNLEYNKEILEIIKILSLCSEYTLLGVLFIKNLKNKDTNQEIFKLGKKVYAWGKMACVFYLDANTDEIKDWVLNESNEENILYNFSAIVYSDKSDIRGRLRKKYFSKDEFSKISFLIYSLMYLDAEKGISFLDDKEELLTNYLEKAKIFVSSEMDYIAIEEVKDYLEEELWLIGPEQRLNPRTDDNYFPLEIANKIVKECEEILNNKV